MKISNSKKQLAKIISENGGWRDGYGFSAQDGDACAVWFYDNAPVRSRGAWWVTSGSGLEHCGIEDVAKLPNWHQTILSRDEYFHLYPVAEPVKVVVENKTTCHLTVADRPTIEQLAADYRNRKGYADRKQQEADAAKAGAEAKLAELVAAGNALGLVLSVASPEPELVITDLRDLQVGDVVWYGGDDGLSPGEYHVMEIETPDYEGFLPVRINDGRWVDTRAGWGFIRRPAKGGANA